MKNREMFEVLASYYALYIKTQSYHWNVTGENFFSLHKLLEDQYSRLAEEIDMVAEQIRILGDKVPASLNAFDELSEISDPNEKLKATAMLEELADDNKKMIKIITRVLKIYEKSNDFATVDLLTGCVRARQKDVWFLSSSF